MHNNYLHTLYSFGVMHDKEEERKKERKKMNKIEIFKFGFLKLVKG